MLGFSINLPWTITGIFIAIVSGPRHVAFLRDPYAITFRVSKLWWMLGYMKNGRAAAIGHVVILGPNVEDRDLAHELVHVEQHQRMPLIQPLLYWLELVRKGYRNNKYEEEAYRRAGNIYKEK